MRSRKSPAFLTESFFARAPVFSLDQAAASLGATTAALTNRLKHHLRTGRLKRVTREIYAVVPPGTDPARFHEDPFLVAAAARPDAVFSHHSALELLGAGHSLWTQVTVWTQARRSTLRTGDSAIRFLPHPAALVRRGDVELGVRQVFRLGVALRVTGAERTLVEGFRQPHLVGGAAELEASASGFGLLEGPLLLRVLEAYGQSRVWSSVGWFLERHRESFPVTPDLLDACERHRPRSPVYLEPGARGGRFAPRWNLVIPEAILAGQGPDER